MKKITICIIYFTISFDLFSIIPRLSFSDEALVLKEKTSQIGGLCYLQSNLFQNLFLLKKPYSAIFVPGYPAVDLSDNKPVLSTFYSIVPSFGLGFIMRMGLRKNREFYFSTYIKTPNIHNNNFFGPSIFTDFGWKFGLIRNNIFSLSYKLSYIQYYNAQPGGGISLKNSLLFGTSFDYINFNGIVFHQFGLNGNYPWFGHFFSTRYFTLVNTIGVEANISVLTKKSVNIIIGGFVQYSIEVDFGHYIYPLQKHYYIESNSIYAINKLYGYFDFGVDLSVSYRFDRKK